MRLTDRGRDHLDMLVDEPTLGISGEFWQLTPTWSRMSSEVHLDTLPSFAARQDEAVIAERDPLDLDECSLEVIPPQRHHALRATGEWPAVVMSEFARKLFANQGSGADTGDPGQAS